MLLGGKTAFRRGSRDGPQQRRLALPAGRTESGGPPGPDGRERVSRLPLPADHQRLPRPFRLPEGEQISRGLPEANPLDASTPAADDLGTQIARENSAHGSVLLLSIATVFARG